MKKRFYALPDGGVAALTSTNDEGPDPQIKIRIGYDKVSKH